MSPSRNGHEDPNDYHNVMNELGAIEKKLNDLKRDFQKSERKQESKEAFKDMTSILPCSRRPVGDVTEEIGNA